MIYRQYLNLLFGQRSKLNALRQLADLPEGSSVRELSRRIGVTEPNLSTVLKELAADGALSSHRHGTALVFRLNYGHYLVEKVLLPLFREEQAALKEAVGWLIKPLKTGIVSAIVFGSIARGDERPDSDIDIAFIVKDGREADSLAEELLDINPKFIRKYGNMVSPYIVTAAGFARKFRANDPLARSVAKDGVLLYGKTISEIL